MATDKAKATGTDLKTLITTDPNWTVAALLHVYSYQTADEQKSDQTEEDNGMGFNGVDAPILSSITKFYNRTGMMTKPQLGVVQRAIGKYHGQCEGIKPVIAQIGPKADTKKDEKPIGKTAVLDGENMILNFYQHALF